MTEYVSPRRPVRPKPEPEPPAPVVLSEQIQRIPAPAFESSKKLKRNKNRKHRYYSFEDENRSVKSIDIFRGIIGEKEGINQDGWFFNKKFGIYGVFDGVSISSGDRPSQAHDLVKKFSTYISTDTTLAECGFKPDEETMTADEVRNAFNLLYEKFISSNQSTFLLSQKNHFTISCVRIGEPITAIHMGDSQAYVHSPSSDIHPLNGYRYFQAPHTPALFNTLPRDVAFIDIERGSQETKQKIKDIISDSYLHIKQIPRDDVGGIVLTTDGITDNIKKINMQEFIQDFQHWFGNRYFSTSFLIDNKTISKEEIEGVADEWKHFWGERNREESDFMGNMIYDICEEFSKRFHAMQKENEKGDYVDLSNEISNTMYRYTNLLKEKNIPLEHGKLHFINLCSTAYDFLEKNQNTSVATIVDEFLEERYMYMPTKHSNIKFLLKEVMAPLFLVYFGFVHETFIQQENVLKIYASKTKELPKNETVWNNFFNELEKNPLKPDDATLMYIGLKSKQ
ncbi:MAG: PP2C family serine/threonine-protein phosphatase [Alphaproteobacteria bacterium]|nr:PP2C family serine/threonine-protein phosphatase [Alphaproteobacteria bacterium]